MKKYLFLIIMFIVTLIIVLLLLFYNPNSKYLGVYKDNFTIKYDFNDEGYNWYYDIDSDLYDIKLNDDGSWTFYPLHEGISEITFNYKNSEDVIKYKIYYKFNVEDNNIYWLEGYGDGLMSYPNPY